MSFESVGRLLALYEDGLYTEAEILSRLTEMAEPETVDGLVDSLPAAWRERLVEYFRGYRDVTPETDLLRIQSCCVAHFEQDPAKLQQLLDEDRARQQDEDAHFRQIAIPAVQGWLARHDPGKRG